MIQSALEYIQATANSIYVFAYTKLFMSAVTCTAMGLFLVKKKYRLRSGVNREDDVQRRSDARTYGVFLMIVGIILFAIKFSVFRLLF